MNPEQRLFIIHKYLTVKFDIFFLFTLTWILCPQRMYITQRHWTFYNLCLLFWFAFLAFFNLFCNMLYNFICLQYIRFINHLILWLCICLGQKNLNRHEGAIFFQNFSYTIFVGKFQTILIQIQRNLCTYFCFISILHLILCTTIAYPMYRHCIRLIRTCINMHLISHHKCGIKSQTEMSDHLIICCLIFILFQKLCCTGKCNLCNIFFYFICSHTNTGINKFQSLLFRIYNNLNLSLVILRQFILTHHIQLFQLRDCITTVRYQFSDKNIMV